MYIKSLNKEKADISKLQTGPIWIGACLFLASLIMSLDIKAAGLNDADAIPHVGKRARESYISYLYATEHKAFAIGPGGAWAWQESLGSPEMAEKSAIESCQQYTQQRCVAYAVNDKLVFDRKNWSTLWGPYLSAKEAQHVAVGSLRGQRFYDLLFKDKHGKEHKLSDYRGKVVFLHFWGSWCPSCMIEFPSLQRMQQQLASSLGQQVALVILQAREAFSQSRQWADRNGFAAVELFDSGSRSSNDVDLKLADGSIMPDRSVAKLFPTSYVLDKNGVVIFSHRGAVNNWLEYLAFFEDAVNGGLATKAESGQSESGLQDKLVARQ